MAQTGLVWPCKQLLFVAKMVGDPVVGGVPAAPVMSRLCLVKPPPQMMPRILCSPSASPHPSPPSRLGLPPMTPVRSALLLQFP